MPLSTLPHHVRPCRRRFELARVHCRLPCRTALSRSAPPAVTAPNYKESTVNFHEPTVEGRQPQDAMIRGNWWELFREPE